MSEVRVHRVAPPDAESAAMWRELLDIEWRERTRRLSAAKLDHLDALLRHHRVTSHQYTTVFLSHVWMRSFGCGDDEAARFFVPERFE